MQGRAFSREFKFEAVRPVKDRGVAVAQAACDIDAIAAGLRARGVTFERYEMDGVTYKDGVNDADGFKMVWFKDPDGNILHLNGA